MAISPEITSHIIEIGTSILLILSFFTLKIIKSKSEKLLKDLKDHNSHDPSQMPKRISMDVHVYNELFRLLFVSSASRAYVLQFHNGSTFNTNNPIWKFSKTYEICNNGVASEVERTQNILIAHMTHLLNPLFNANDPAIPGVKHIDTPSCTNLISNNNFKVYKATAEKISHYYISSYLLNRSIKECIYAPIFDKNNNIIGLICLDYCNDYQYDELNDPGMIKELYRVSAKISEQI
jgi:hypothetical protein